MKRMPAPLRVALAAGLSLFLPSAIAGAPAPAAASGMPVFDAGNYAQNLVQAARALDQVKNQLKSLQNEASMLQNMARNLQTIDFPQLDRISAAMQRIDGLMGKAQQIDFRIDGLDRKIDALFPGELKRALSSDERVRDARARLDAARSAYRQAILLQAQVAQNAEEDAAMLRQLADASQGAVGALQAQQAAGQLLALSVKQQLQIQNLMAAEYREQSVERARRAQSEDDARATTARFLGSARN